MIYVVKNLNSIKFVKKAIDHEVARMLEMVKNGMAWQYEKYSKSAVLKKAQASAKSMSIGLWRDPYPVAPWEFRRK